MKPRRDNMNLGYREQKPMRGENNVREGKAGHGLPEKTVRESDRRTAPAPERYRLRHDAGAGEQEGAGQTDCVKL